MRGNPARGGGIGGEKRGRKRGGRGGFQAVFREGRRGVQREKRDLLKFFCRNGYFTFFFNGDYSICFYRNFQISSTQMKYTVFYFH